MSGSSKSRESRGAIDLGVSAIVSRRISTREAIMRVEIIIGEYRFVKPNRLVKRLSIDHEFYRPRD